ncbi:hypothetical protein JOM56_002295 [Amanita muscaria]
MPPSLPFDKLNESNYDDWKLQMEAHLEEKELFSIIDGTEEMPMTGPNSKSMRSKIHSARGLGTLLTMRRNFFTMTMPADTSIASWVAQVRHAAYKLDECYRLEQADHAIKSETDTPSLSSFSLRHVTDLDKVMVLTSGLSPTFNSLLVYIAAIPISMLDFEDIVTRLLNEEQRQKISPIPTKPVTPITVMRTRGF